MKQQFRTPGIDAEDSRRTTARGSVVRQKVFGIGFHKTGTSSLASALRLLGYTVAGRFVVDDQTIGDTVIVDRAIQIANAVDAVQDNPWPLVYRGLDSAFPGSKFILTIRDTDEWWVSALGHFGGKSTAMRTWIYGVGDPEGHEDLYKRRYEAHNDEVLEYFSDRPDDLLVFAITDGEGWDRLCPFVGETIPDEPFPHRRPNTADTLNRKLRRRLRKVFLRRS